MRPFFDSEELNVLMPRQIDFIFDLFEENPLNGPLSGDVDMASDKSGMSGKSLS